MTRANPAPSAAARDAVLASLTDHGRATVAELAARLGFSGSHTARTLRKLRGEGAVQVVGADRRRRGRGRFPDVWGLAIKGAHE